MGEFPNHVASWTVVAYGEVTHVRAILSVAADPGAIFPHNLSVVTPAVKIGHVWEILAVKAAEVVDLAGVPQLTNDLLQLIGLGARGGRAGSNVLAVVGSRAQGDVVVEIAGGGQSGCRGSESTVPGHWGGRMVSAMKIVDLDTGAGI